MINNLRTGVVFSCLLRNFIADRLQLKSLLEAGRPKQSVFVKLISAIDIMSSTLLA